MKDNQILSSAFNKVKNIEYLYGDDIPWSAIEKGFQFDDEKIFLANKARGIFKPKQMSRGVLSIKTTIPRQGRVNIYSDEESNNGYFIYSLQTGDPRGGGNKHLWESLEDESPFIYFYPVAPGIYKALWPCFVTSINSENMNCQVVVGAPKDSPIEAETITYNLPTEIEREYRIAESRVRIHQAVFREQVLKAYDNKCAITGLPIPTLLDAAHITPDSHETGAAIVTNGVSLSKIHHRAFDASLLGIDPDFKIHISEKLLNIDDGIMLEGGLKAFQGKKINVPLNSNHKPDRYRLDERFHKYLLDQNL